MSLPIFELKKAIRAALVADATLTGMLGGAAMHDETPRGANPPYIVFGEANCRDQSTAIGRAHETLLSLHVLSGQGGTKEAQLIAARVETLLHDSSLSLTGHRLVNLTLAGSELRRERNAEMSRATLKFRAFTELL
jgi:hypothetical protein